MIRIKIWGEINSQTSYVVEQAIASIVDENEPVIVLINTVGGTLVDATIIATLLHGIKNPVITVTMGNCLSAGAMIFNCGQKRYIAKDTKYMIHQPMIIGTTIENAYSSQETHYDLMQSLKKYKKYALKGTNIPQEKLDVFVKYGQDLYLTPSECIKYNVATDTFKSWPKLYKQEYVPDGERIISFDYAEAPQQAAE